MQVFVETLNQINESKNTFEQKLRRVTGMMTFLGASPQVTIIHARAG